MQSPDLQRLKHIAEYCKAIQLTMKRYGLRYEDYLLDPDYQRSVCFSLFQIGELSAYLSEEFRAKTQNAMPWSAIKKMRNIVVHNYGHIDHKIVWQTMVEDIPEMLAFCEKHLK